jgi:hypothetical protein
MDQSTESTVAPRPAGLAPTRSLFRAGADIAVSASVIIFSLFYIKYKIITTFQHYDDEGYMMVTVSNFLRGHPLYDGIPTVYGPFYYLFELVVHSLLGVPLTNDGTRQISVVMWLTTALAVGAFVWRATGRASLTVLAYVLTVYHLRWIANEPGHPQELVGFLLACAPLLACWVLDRDRPGWLAPGLGAIAACLTLTKLNVGVFATLAFLLAIAGVPRPGWWDRTLAGLLWATTLLLPSLLLRAYLDVGWAQRFVLVVSLSLAALGVMSRAVVPPHGVRLHGFVVAAFAVAISLLAFVGVRGTTAPGMLEGLVLTSYRLSVVGFLFAIGSKWTVIPWGVLCLLLAILNARRPFAEWPAPVSYTLPFLKGLFGASVIVFLFAQGEQNRLITYGTPLVWLVLTPTAGRSMPGGAYLTRRILAFLAVLETLQVFPMAGSQKGFGSFLILVSAVVCLGDCLGWVESTFPTRAAVPAIRRAGFALTWIASSLLLVNSVRGLDALYRDGVAIEAPGTGSLRVPEGQAAIYRWLVSNLARHADTFYSEVGNNSMYSWTGKSPPSLVTTGNTIEGMPHKYCDIIIRSLEEHPNACVVSHPNLFPHVYADIRDRSIPLLSYIDRTFTNCGEVAEYEFRVKKGRPRPILVDCARWLPGEAGGTTQQPSGPRRRPDVALDLTPAPGRVAHRVTVNDLDRGRLIADSDPAHSAGALTVLEFDPNGRASPVADLSVGLDLSSMRRLALSFPPGVAFDRDHFLVVRFLDREGRLIRSIPFLTAAEEGEMSAGPAG